MSKIIVTGGNGYVGREVVRLLQIGHEVCVVDNLASGPIRFTDEERERIRFEDLDIADRRGVARLFADFAPDVVIHLAAIHYIPDCERDPIQAIRVNLLGTMTVLAETPHGARFVFASSGAVYKPDESPHDEASLRQPTDVYGITKLQGEEFVLHFAARNNLSAVVVRLFNVVGPGETNPHLLPEIVAQLKAGRRTVRLGNLWPKRDYIHVRDAAKGFVATALGEGVEVGETVTVNLGTSASYSVGEVVAKLRTVARIDFAIEEEGGRVRKSDRPFLAADTQRIRRRFGWRPTLTIDDAMADLWRNPELTESLAARYR